MGARRLTAALITDRLAADFIYTPFQHPTTQVNAVTTK